MTASYSRAAQLAEPQQDKLALAIERTASARAIAGNTLQHHADSPAAIDAMIDLVASAQQWVHFENYIVRDDATGRRVAEALAERARVGVRVRILYDALGSFGTGYGFWRGLRRAGVEVRAFHPIFSGHPFDIFVRDHRKLVVADGTRAMLGGLCIGDEWAGDPAKGREPWRDTMVTVCGPAATAFDASFASLWARVGPPLAADELNADPEACGPVAVQAIAGVPFEGRMYRVTQLIAAAALERLWITDAYLVPPAPLYAALLEAARSGVDVRLLVPGATDLPVLRGFTRAGYRELLRAGVRVFEWLGPMIHAKTLVADRRWARVGSSNLNVSSLFANYELDFLADDVATADLLAAQFRRDLQESREIVLQPRRRLLPPRLVDTVAQDGQHGAADEAPRRPGSRVKRSGYQLGAVAVVALRRVAGGLRRALAATAAMLFLIIGALLLVFPRVAGAIVAALAFWMALGFAVYGVGKRRARDREDGD